MVLLGFLLNKTSSLRSLEHSLNHDYPILLQVTRHVREHLAQVGAEYEVQAEEAELDDVVDFIVLIRALRNYLRLRTDHLILPDARP